MVGRTLWLDGIRQAWSKRSVVWLSGVRRVGKTTLARMLPEASYLNCDLPSVRRLVADPEAFLESQSKGSPLVLDEVHRLADPSLLLKIAADEHLHRFAELRRSLAPPSKGSDGDVLRRGCGGRREEAFIAGEAGEAALTATRELVERGTRPTELPAGCRWCYCPRVYGGHG